MSRARKAVIAVVASSLVVVAEASGVAVGAGVAAGSQTGSTQTRLQSPISGLDTWSQYSYSPDRIGHNPMETLIDTTTVGSMSLKWTYAAGAAIWHSSGAVANGILYFGSMDRYLYALDAATGGFIWRYGAGAGVDSSPAVGNGVVYVGASNGVLHAVNATTGARIWTFATEGKMGENSPALVDETVYMTSKDGYLYSINATTGAMNWKTPHNFWKANKSAAVGYSKVYFGSDDKYLYAFDATTGAFRWRALTGGFVKSTPSVALGKVFVGSEDKHLYAFDADNGSLAWKVGPFPYGGKVLGAPAVWNNTVYVDTAENQPSGSHVYALDPNTGATRCVEPLSDYSGSAIAIVNGVAFAVSNGKEVFALDALTCRKLWNSTWGTIAGNLLTSPAVVNGMMYIGDFSGATSGVMYAFGL